MASTHQISSERSLHVASAAKAAVGKDDSALLDEFSRLVDDLVSHVSKQQSSSTSNELITVSVAAPREIVKEKPKKQEVQSASPEATPQAESDDAEAVTDEEVTSTKSEDSCDQEAATPEPSDAPVEKTDATEVSVVAAAQVAPGTKAEAQVTEVTQESVEGESEAAIAQDLLDSGGEQSAAAATKAATDGKSAKAVAQAAESAVAQAVKATVESDSATQAAPVSAEAPVETTMADAIAKKSASDDGKSDTSSKQRQAEVSAAAVGAAAAAVSSANGEESVTGILLRHAFSAVSKALGIERASSSQQSASQQTLTAPVRSPSPEAEAHQPKLKALPRQTALRLMERVENTLQEVARSKDGKSVSLKLEPADLGTMRVDVSIRDGVLHARLTPESKPVATFLQEKAHELQSMLRKLGLNVDSVTVSVRSEEFTSAQGEQNGQGLGKNNLSGDGQGGQSGNNFPSFASGFQNAGSERSGKPLEDHWVA